MIAPPIKHFRILAIAPSSRGFGFALLEAEQTLLDWGVKPVKGDKNRGSIAKLEKLIALYHPGAIVLEDHSFEDSRRSPRIWELGRDITEMAKSRRIPVGLLSRSEVRSPFFGDGQGTKQAVAEVLAEQFPEELGTRLPPKRRPWTSEDYRMDIFDAVALAVAFRFRKSGKPFKAIDRIEPQQVQKPAE